MTPINTILRQATRLDDEPLNILTCPTHEAYETGLSLTGHNFYAFWQEGIKRWNHNYRRPPDNYVLLPDKSLPNHVDFDLVLSQNKFGQYQVLSQIARSLHLPLVSLEHTLPDPLWTPNIIDACRKMRGDLNVFISTYSLGQWRWEDTRDTLVVHHMIDTDVFSPSEYIPFVARQPYALSVVNDFRNRDRFCGFSVWTKLAQKVKTKLRGDTPGLSTATQSIGELVSEYQNARVYLNTSLVSPIPTALLEAMACGCCPISTATCMVPEIIENGVNGFCSNNLEELIEKCQLVLNDVELAEYLGNNAKQTIEDMFSKDRFIKNWNHVFHTVKNKVFIG